MRVFVLTLSIGVFLGAAATYLVMSQPVIYTGKPDIVDGDTLRFHPNGKKRLVRLAGIEAAELPVKCRRKGGYKADKPDCTNASSTALFNRISGKVVRCTQIMRDGELIIGTFGRTIAICTENRKDLSQWMIEACQVARPKHKAHRLPQYDEIFKASNCST